MAGFEHGRSFVGHAGVSSESAAIAITVSQRCWFLPNSCRSCGFSQPQSLDVFPLPRLRSTPSPGARRKIRPGRDAVDRHIGTFRCTKIFQMDLRASPVLNARSDAVAGLSILRPARRLADHRAETSGGRVRRDAPGIFRALHATRGCRRKSPAPPPKIGISVAAVGRVCWEVATGIAMKPPDRNNQVLA